MEPIAIVGQACTLPGALTPAELWANLIAGRNCLSQAPPGRWGLARSTAMGTVEDFADRTWSDIGGYVNGFDAVFDPTGFLLSADEIRELDPLFQWVLHGAREALRAIDHDAPSPRTGLVLGGLSFPTSAMARYAESVWLEAQGADFAGGRSAERAGISRPHARNRFSSGLPAHLAARALGLGAGAFTVDAACASSLYAIKLACDQLHDGRADVMVAGAVSRTDDLFTHVGFSALGALSRTGRSRPFHREADGLVPAEGAGFVVLQRLRDAIREGRNILGVIRAVGLSNDGRGRGLLAPSEEGQERAMRAAYAQAGIDPKDIGLVECHATGTPVGDATEIRSTARVFESCSDVPIGSLKSNLGHLVAAAGIAGLLKVLASIENGKRVPTLFADPSIDVLQSTPFRVVREVEDWTGPRRAALSAFGFGGNNAHLIVEAFDGPSSLASFAAKHREQVAIVAMGARVADGESVDDFANALFDGTLHKTARTSVSVALNGLKFPPHDLSQALAQQTLILEAAREAAASINLPRERTSVIVGMGCDPELARYGARWKVVEWARKWSSETGGSIDHAWLTSARDAFQDKLEAAGALGAMPNIPANRINGQLDVAGPSFTVAAEEASGIVALELAARALREHEIDAAVIGAVDLSHELVHRTALAALGNTKPPGDAAVVLVLKRLADARRDKDRVYALLGEDDQAAMVLGDTETGSVDLDEVFGHAHAASGLVHVTAGALALRSRTMLRTGAPAVPWVGPSTVRISVRVLEAGERTLTLTTDPEATVENEIESAVESCTANIAAERSVESCLTLAAHLPSPRLPSFEPTVEVMARAPVLPPVLEPLSTNGTPVATFTSTATTDVLVRFAAYQEQLGNIHRAFLAQHAEIHQRFLTLRQTAEANLLHVAVQSSTLRLQDKLKLELKTQALPLETAPKPNGKPVLPGPKFDRAQLEVLAGGSISSVFGELFKAQDSYSRQVRMPQPPLLLADRVTGIEAAAGSMETGTIWTETTVSLDGWYLDSAGRMPAGIMIEAGQADLLLISWLGVDLLNRGERVYRLLGCELTFKGGLPVPGDTLAFRIQIDGHAQQGEVRLFFFHYDCHVNGEHRLTVRNAQAGFFSDKELRESAGVLWDCAEAIAPVNRRVDPPAVVCHSRAFNREQLSAFAEGRPYECFGKGWEKTQAHVRTARITAGRMLLLEKVTEFNPGGGPWGRGYLRAETAVTPHDWFFEGHFKNDPCMPGTLMFEACLQA
ncbi:MAG TPA: beta-ketoacyl synthase N-terminal-like domain-containing protein, partial [Pyrinomonadaceae bacterium]|nr:beta-ketoacyl synthase N-terminal-like domain-containing protein [Pyrinomonadaceae bacterium]